MTAPEIEISILIKNPARDSWDGEWRFQLLQNFLVLAGELWQVGITEIFIDGSFVEEKDRPNDIDGYFECELKHFVHKQLHRKLNALNEHKVWTWARQDMEHDPETGKRVLPMRRLYGVELFPDYPGSFTGIRDRKSSFRLPGGLPNHLGWEHQEGDREARERR